IEMGYADAIEQIECIKSVITERRDPDYYDTRRAEYNATLNPLIFEAYEINGLTTEQNLYVRDFLHTSSKRGGSSQREMPFEELQENLYRILSNGDFSTEFPTIKYNDQTERYKFYINLKTKPQLKLSVGGHLSSTAFNQLFFSLNYQKIRRVAQSYYADLYLGTMSTSAKVGGRTDFYLKTPLFIDYYYSFSNLNLEYNNLGNITDVTNSESTKTRDNHISTAFGLPISRRSLLTLRANAGLAYYYYDAVSYSSDMADIDPSLLYDRTRLGFAALKMEYQRSTLNRRAYPTSGSRLSISSIAVAGRDRNYQTLSGTSVSSPASDHLWVGGRLTYDKYFKPPGDSWLSLGFNFDAVYTTLQQFGNPTASMLIMPAYQPVTTSKMIFMPDYSADKYIGMGVIPTFNVNSNMLLRVGAYGLYRNIYTVDGVDESVISPKQLHYIAETSLVYQSPVGAINVSLTKYDIDSWNNLYFTFGLGIPILAPKGTFY
ncbi:MAG: phospholipase, partial [Rikenellaceae bacterium]